MSGFIRSPEPPPQLRQQYLDTLEEPQEFFLEDLVSLGQFWTHHDGCYGVVHGNFLAEFFNPTDDHSTKLLRLFQEQLGFSKALVKSFDRDLMRACQDLGWTGSVGGFLFRRRESRTPKTFPAAIFSAAIRTDIEPIWQINDDFFESQDEVAGLAETDKLWTVRVDGEIAGCGVANRFIEDRDAVDIGMMVAPHFRRRGLGTHIVSEIAGRIEKDGLRPICGCGASNSASKATLEKAGFVSDHQLMSFSA